MKRAVFVGSFDPFSLGHKDVAMRAAELFDELIIGIAVDNGKHSADVHMREQIVKASLDDKKNVRVACFDGLTTDFMKKVESNILIRGVRTAADFDYERSLMGVYRSLMPDIQFVVLPARYELSHISSTAIRELCAVGAPIKGYVDQNAESLIHKLYSI